MPIRTVARGPSRLLGAAVSAAATAATVAVAGPSGAAAADPLLSQGKPATASSTENAGTAGPAARRRQHRHPLVAARSAIHSGSRSTSAPPPPISQVVLNWEAAYAPAFQIQTSADGTDLDHDLLTTTGTGGIQTLAVTGSGRYVRMNGTARATALRLLAVGVPGVRHDRRRPALRHRQRGAGPAGHRLLHRERRHAGRAPRSTATPAPAGPARSATRSGSRSTSAPPQPICQVVLTLGGRVRDRVPDPGRRRRRPPGRPSTRPPPAPAAPRRSPSTAPAGTCGCTAPPGPPGTATRCSRCAVVRTTGRHDRPRRLPGGGDLGPERARSSTRRCPAPTIQSAARRGLRRSRRPTSSAPSATRCCSSRARYNVNANDRLLHLGHRPRPQPGRRQHQRRRHRRRRLVRRQRHPELLALGGELRSTRRRAHRWAVVAGRAVPPGGHPRRPRTWPRTATAGPAAATSPTAGSSARCSRTRSSSGSPATATIGG